MGLADMIGQMVLQGMAKPAQGRMQTGAAAAAPGIEQVLGALLGGGAAAGGAGGIGVDPMGNLGRMAADPRTAAAAPTGGGVGDLLGAILGGAQAPAARGGAEGGGVLGDLLGAVLGGAGGRPGARAGGGGGLGDLLGAVLGGAGGAAGGGAGARPSGGLGDLLGALTGGSGGAAGGSAMAVLAGLAVQALQASQASAAAAPVAPEQAVALVDAGAQRLVLKSMIAAMKADGRIDADEIARLKSEAGRDGVDAAEAAFIEAELTAPLDLDALAAAARTPAQAAEAYVAALVAITIDTDRERAWLRALAEALGLNAATAAELHRMTGAPAP
jgi:uncharacterized membrane protein YebE (DUF533 family)